MTIRTLHIQRATQGLTEETVLMAREAEGLSRIFCINIDAIAEGSESDNQIADTVNTLTLLQRNDIVEIDAEWEPEGTLAEMATKVRSIKWVMKS